MKRRHTLYKGIKEQDFKRVYEVLDMESSKYTL